MATMQKARAHFAGVVLGDNRIWVIGGVQDHEWNIQHSDHELLYQYVNSPYWSDPGFEMPKAMYNLCITPMDDDKYVNGLHNLILQ